METFILIFIYSVIGLAASIYAVYLLWGYQLFLDLKKNNARKLLYLTVAWGLFTHSLILGAITTDPQTTVSWWQTIVFYLIISSTTVVGYSLTYFLYKKITTLVHKISTHNKYNIILSGMSIPILIMCAEYMRSFVFTVIMSGQSMGLGLSDTVSSVANVLAFTPLVSLAYIGHVYYLTFILFTIIVVLFYTLFLIKREMSLFKSNKYFKKDLNYKAYKVNNLANIIKSIFKIICPLLILFIFIKAQLYYVQYIRLVGQEETRLITGQPQPDINMLIIPTDIPTHYNEKDKQAAAILNRSQADNQNRIDTLYRTYSDNNTDKNKEKNPTNTIKEIDIIVLPEVINYPQSLSKKESKLPILQGLFLKDKDSKYTNSSLYIDDTENSKNSNYRNKIYLFPFYEYRPYISPLPSFYEVTPRGGSQDFYTQVKGGEPQYTIKDGQLLISNKEKIYKWSTIICSEFYSYDYLKLLKSHNYDYVITQSSLAIFNHSKWLYAYILMAQKVNAAYIGIPIIQVSNAGPSFVIRSNRLDYYSESDRPFIYNPNN